MEDQTMKKIFILFLLLISFQTYSEDTSNMIISIPPNFLPGTVKEILTNEAIKKPLSNAFKLFSLTAIGLGGAASGIYLTVRGIQKAFLEKEQNNAKPFWQTNLPRGLITASFGLCTTTASIYLILKSNHLVDRFS